MNTNCATRSERASFLSPVSYKWFLSIFAIFISTFNTLVVAQEPQQDSKPNDRVVVVGAGLAGLMAAYELEKNKVEVAVFEASERAGGRVRTENGPNGQWELGAELIDSKHARLLQAAKELGLETIDRLGPSREARKSFFIAGEKLSHAEFGKRMFQSSLEALRRIAADVTRVRRNQEARAEIDRLTVREYLNLVLKPRDAELRRYLQTLAETELGRSHKETSALALISGLIINEEQQKLDFLPWHDESIVIKGGSQRLTDALARDLDLSLQHRLVEIAKLPNGSYRLGFESPSGKKEVSASDVVLAIPLTQLGKVKLTGFDWPADLKDKLTHASYADVTKLILEFRTPFWLKAGDTGRLVSDRGFVAWDSSPSCEGCHGFLTIYRHQGSQGGLQTARLIESILSDLDRAYAGARQGYLGSKQERWREAYSYSPWPQALTKPSAGDGKLPSGLYLAGEAFSERHQGYMNGAVETGVDVASQIRVDRKVKRLSVRYNVIPGGRVRIMPGSIIQGSTDAGGMQPDYLVDTNDPHVKDLLEKSKWIGSRSQTVTAKIESLRALLRSRLPGREYDDGHYLRLLSQHRSQKGDSTPIGLGDYLRVGSGVCREYGLLTNLMLREAGIDAEYIYVRQAFVNKIEGHALNVVNLGGTETIIDFYEPYFHGYSLAESMSKEGLTSQSRGVEGLAVPSDEARRITRISSYPYYFLPSVSSVASPLSQSRPSFQSTIQPTSPAPAVRSCTDVFKRVN